MKQIAIVTPNRPGILADVAAAVGEKGVNIESIEAEAVGGLGVVRMTASDYDLAMRALHDAGFNPLSEEVFLVRLDDSPGSLAKIARRFKDASIDIKSLRLVGRDGKQAIAAISCEGADEAKALVKDVLIG